MGTRGDIACCGRRYADQQPRLDTLGATSEGSAHQRRPLLTTWRGCHQQGCEMRLIHEIVVMLGTSHPCTLGPATIRYLQHVALVFTKVISKVQSCTLHFQFVQRCLYEFLICFSNKFVFIE